eukprot:1139060-Pelagomonas_calceolata.AAC.7
MANEVRKCTSACGFSGHQKVALATNRSFPSVTPYLAASYAILINTMISVVMFVNAMVFLMLYLLYCAMAVEEEGP